MPTWQHYIQHRTAWSTKHSNTTVTTYGSWYDEYYCYYYHDINILCNTTINIDQTLDVSLPWAAFLLGACQPHALQLDHSPQCYLFKDIPKRCNLLLHKNINLANIITFLKCLPTSLTSFIIHIYILVIIIIILIFIIIITIIIMAQGKVATCQNTVVFPHSDHEE